MYSMLIENFESDLAISEYRLTEDMEYLHEEKDWKKRMKDFLHDIIEKIRKFISSLMDGFHRACRKKYAALKDEKSKVYINMALDSEASEVITGMYSNMKDILDYVNKESTKVAEENIKYAKVGSWALQAQLKDNFDFKKALGKLEQYKAKSNDYEETSRQRGMEFLRKVLRNNVTLENLIRKLGQLRSKLETTIQECVNTKQLLNSRRLISLLSESVKEFGGKIRHVMSYELKAIRIVH